MIYPPSLPPPLNGNKMNQSIFIAFLILIVSACGIFKDAGPAAPSKEPENQEEPKEEETRPDEIEEVEEPPTLPIDTMKVVEDSVILVEEPRYEKKEQYALRLYLPLLPIQDKEEEETDAKSPGLNSWNEQFMEYLAGFRLGLENAEDSLGDFAYSLSVESSKDMDKGMATKDSLELPRTDLVIGGVSKESLDLFSNWAARTGSIFVSPWVPFSPLLQNERYIQLTPGLEAHCQKVASFLIDQYRLEQIFILVSEENKDRVQCFNEYFTKRGATVSFQSILMDPDFEEEDMETLAPSFSETDTNIIVIPESRNKAFIHKVISRLSVLEDYQFQLIGLQSWLKYDLLYNYFEKIPFLLSVDQFYQKDSMAFREFEKVYFDKYHELPTDWSVKGYDQASWIAYGLHNYGMDLPEELDEIYIEGLGMDFDFRIHQIEQTTTDSLYFNINNAVQIIEYDEHHFRKISE